MRILLLDDEEYILTALQRTLVSLGHAVDCSSDPKGAVPMAETGDYDFVLVDYRMPVHDGAWFLRNSHIPKKTKILLMTAYVDRDIINEMFKLGAKGYLIKPIERPELEMHLSFHSTRQNTDPSV